LTTDERIDRLTENLDRLAGVVNALASTVVAHDNQIDALIKFSEQNAREWQQLRREFQAYLDTLPKN
jgi:hypothetical protein